ncbi:amino acid ABC transporter substrate-binding protein [Magnetococcales bacterium HHB-1]
MKQIKTGLWSVVSLMILFLVPNAYAGGTIKVGASVAMTGKYSRTGQEQLNGFRMWIKNINAQGGLLGKQVELVHYDDESKPATGARLYEKLITDDKVDLLLGPYSSGVTLAASTVAEKHGFPMVSTGASSNKIWRRGYKNVFGLYTPAEIYMDQIIEFAHEKGLKKVALIFADTAFPRSVAEGVRKKTAALGMKLIFDQEYGKGSTDFAAMIVNMRISRPDVIIGGSYLPDSVAFMRQAKEYRLNAKIFAFAVGPGLPDFGKNLGKDATGVMGNTQWEPTLNIAGAAAFSEKYEKKYGHKPGYHAAGGYGAGQVLEAAVKKTGNLDRNALRAALNDLDIVTVFGRYKVDETGQQVGKPGYAIQWLDGQRHIILPQAVRTHAPLYPFTTWGHR